MDDLATTVPAFLSRHGCGGALLEHTARVARRARALAAAAGAYPEAAEAAGWLHDIGNIFPADQRVAAARAREIPVLPEEAAHPALLHQKLSAQLARKEFGVTGEAVLAAIGCHTTLRPGATLLDKLLFLADKMEWDAADREGVPDGLLNSIDDAVIAFMRQKAIKVVHPWWRAAYEDLAGPRVLSKTLEV